MGIFLFSFLIFQYFILRKNENFPNVASNTNNELAN